ncbi:MAG: cbb3-type cytochrome oxidase assembly protein CcoS [Xanthomonadales bacterium]|nr:cbb3-type cytochrome oxidase assembly protein CcoS [Xanthomonadales bacterium]
MKIIFVLIPLSLILLAVAIWGFFWMVRNDQFDDLESPAWRILTDDDPPRPDDQTRNEP